MEKNKKEEEIKNPVRKDVTPQETTTPAALSDLLKDIDANQLQVLIQLLRATKRPTDTAPTATPQNFIQQFALYENGATIRLYVWVNGTWRYAGLT